MTGRFDAWRPLVIGEGVTREVVDATPLTGCPGVEWCSWRAGADAVEQVLRVREKLREMHAEVVVTNDLPHGFIAAALDHHRGVRCAAWLHSASHDGEALVTNCFELADAWRSVSHEGRKRALSVAAELGLEIPGARATAPAFVDVAAEFSTPLDDEAAAGTLRLLYAARLEKYHKRVLDLVSLADELLSLGQKFHLTIAGEGPAEGELRSAMAGHMAAGRVEFVGAVSGGTMRRLLADCHALVLVSASEAAPMCVMEAMAAGRMVAVTASCGEASQWVRDGVEGAVARTGCMRELALRLYAAWARPGTVRTMSHAAWARARELFSLESRRPAMQALVEEAWAVDRQSRTPCPSAREARWKNILRALRAVGPVTPESTAALARMWSGELGEPADLPLSVEPRPSPAERRLGRVMEELRRTGCKRCALYGGGRHTQSLVATLERTPEVVAIVDDAAGRPHGPPSEIGGKPVIAPGQLSMLGVDAVIISSDEHEREMMARARTFASWVLPLYGPEGACDAGSPAVQSVDMHAA
jgi:glycosyltransferase involved in cell wall biosynthesis